MIKNISFEVLHRSKYNSSESTGFVLIVRDTDGNTIYEKGTGGMWDEPFKTRLQAESFAKELMIRVVSKDDLFIIGECLSNIIEYGYFTEDSPDIKAIKYIVGI